MDFQEARSKVGAGWYTVLDTRYRSLPAGGRITEVSRVDGRLHVAASGVTARYQERIRAAEAESGRTCEDCGNNGGRRRDLPDGEVLTLCDACHLLRARRG